MVGILAAPFSFKYAAFNAGLGWIGKNDVAITEKYGPRVRLSAVLIDKQFTYGQRIVKSNCLDLCKKCIEICAIIFYIILLPPVSFLYDEAESWTISMETEAAYGTCDTNVFSLLVE